MTRLVTVLLAASLLPLPALADRVLSLGGSVTEIVYALGEEDRLVARDTTSNFPQGALDLPDVGYIRQLSPEGVLSVAPDLIISEAGAGPLETVQILEEARIPFVEMPGGHDRETVRAKILGVAEALGVPEKGAALADEVDADLDAALSQVDASAPLRVLFVLSTAGGRITAAGEATSGAAIIALAGGQNAISSVEGYKQMSDEAIAAANPDVILMMNHAGDLIGTADELFAHPALATTPAGRNRALISMDGMMLTGFGPRIGEAVTELSSQLAALGD